MPRRAGQRPNIEDHVPSKITEVISSAWATDPSSRPTFQKILSALRDPSLSFGGAFAEVETGLRDQF